LRVQIIALGAEVGEKINARPTCTLRPCICGFRVGLAGEWGWRGG
jgi:hypothetical protein